MCNGGEGEGEGVGLRCNINCYKCFLFLLMRIGNILTFLKKNQKAILSIECQGILAKWRGKEGLFRRVQEGGPHCEITPKSTWLSWEIKVSIFMKFEIILCLLWFSLDPLTNKHCWVWKSVKNFRNFLNTLRTTIMYNV